MSVSPAGTSLAVTTDDHVGPLTTVEVGSLPLSWFDGVLSPGDLGALHDATEMAQIRLSGRTIWNVSSTACGGGAKARNLLKLLTPPGPRSGEL